MLPSPSRLDDRVALAGLTVDTDLRARLLAYYELLSRWNAKINLTSLNEPDEAIDRLLIEPVAAARSLRAGSRLADLGSGGGSPAIPLALALNSPLLLMVESKGRKAAFLREAARTVGLNATVEAARFEDVASSGRFSQDYDVVSMRAVRMDAVALTSAVRLLAPDGRIALFVSAGTTVPLLDSLRLTARAPLIGKAELVQLASDVPRGTQTRL